ncbi:MAG UNVERIFIED_CONTAM: recombinase family protein, partial [Thermobifida fusca]
MARRTRTRTVARAAADAELRVAIYLRRSTDDEHQPFSLDAQQTRLHAYIASQPGWRLVATFTDDASGATLDRPGLSDAMAAARAGAFDILLVYRVDRFTRRIRDLSYLVDELDKAGVAFRSATEPFDTGTPAGRMMVQMLGVFAEFERALIIDRVINGMERKAAKGKWTLGTTPYGYTIDPVEHVLLREPAEAAIVGKIFHLYTYRRLGTRAVAAHLNQRGLHRRSGRPWSHKTVTDVLINRVYLGEVHFRAVVVERAHEPLITPETFELADRILTDRGENPARKAAAATDYHLSGKITCPRCGHTYLGSNATGRHRIYRYYTCATRSRYGVQHCPAPRIDADHVDEEILTALCDFYTSHTDLLAEAIAAARVAYRAARTATEQELATVTGLLATKEAAVDKYLVDFEADKLSPGAVSRRVDQLAEEIRQLRLRRDELLLRLDDDPGEPTRDQVDQTRA